MRVLRFHGEPPKRRQEVLAVCSVPGVRWRRSDDLVGLECLDRDGRPLVVELDRANLRTIGQQLRALGWAEFERAPLLSPESDRRGP